MSAGGERLHPQGADVQLIADIQRFFILQVAHLCKLKPNDSITLVW